MTTVLAPARSTAAGSGIGSRPPSKGALAYAVMVGGYPIAWALGLGPGIWLLVPAFMLLRLLQERPVVIPDGAVLYGLFLVLMAGSVVQVGTPGRLALFVLRGGWYIGAFISLLYIVRAGDRRTRDHVITGMVLLWMAAVVGGYLAILTPELQWPPAAAKLLPGLIANDEFVQDLITPSAAEIQVFRYEGVTLYRPSAPFAYTNGWGSTMAILTPIAVAAVRARIRWLPRPFLVAMLAASVVPFYVALNRGSWLTLGAGLLYATARRSVVTRSFLPLKILLAIGLLGAAVVASTGLLDTATERLETRSADSNETRASIYGETLSAAARSPMIGYGGPRTNPANPSGPPLGTHGQLWALLYGHGFVAAGLYVAFFVTSALRARPPDPVGHWLKVALVVGLLQFPIYGHLPQQSFIMMGLVGLLVTGADVSSASRIPGRVARRADDSVPDIAR